MKIFKKNSTAFSLIELSTVILIIGILVIGISKGSRIIKESRLKAAAALSAGSPVNSIPNLALWLDVTSTENLAVGGVYGTVSPDASVSDWRDRNSQTTNKIVFTNPIAANRPKYTLGAIGGLPALKFDGVDDILSTGSTSIGAGDDEYTMILVWKPLVVMGQFLVFEQKPLVDTNHMCAAYYIDNGNFRFSNYSNDTAPLTALSNGTSYITSIVVNHNTTSRDLVYYSNSNNGTITTVPSPALANIGAGGMSVGGRFSDLVGNGIFTFNGYISEAMIFDRALSASEIKSINSYLSQKYSIKLN